MDKQINIPDHLIQLLRIARSITVLTGAGVSAESGIPTFRDSQTGLWAHYRPEELASPQAFQKDPALVWNWYAWRLSLVRKSKPNSAHLALAAMERQVADFTLITQNVDGLHQQAGSKHVVELHGNIRRARCASDAQIIRDLLLEGETYPPTCEHCGGLLRPDVVWFGEPLPEAALQEAVRASQCCDIFLSVGTSGAVEPAASLPYEALRHGAQTIEINPMPTPLTVYTRFSFAVPAGAILPLLVEAAWPEEGRE